MAIMLRNRIVIHIFRERLMMDTGKAESSIRVKG